MVSCLSKKSRMFRPGLPHPVPTVPPAKTKNKNSNKKKTKRFSDLKSGMSQKTSSVNRTILLLSTGSRGDCQPFIPLALALNSHGYKTVLGAAPNHQQFVESYKIKVSFFFLFSCISNCSSFQLAQTPRNF